MKTHAILAAIVLLAASQTIFSAQAAESLTRIQVVERLEAAGYRNFRKLVLNADQWEGEGIKNDVWISFQADPRSGRVFFEHVVD